MKSPRGQVRAVCLISTGLDSPVAAYLTVRSGVVPVLLSFAHDEADSGTGGRLERMIRKVKESTKAGSLVTYIVPHRDVLQEIVARAPQRLTCVLCRRMMLRVALRIARLEDASFIVTGEILGEHASQTLENIFAENSASRGMPIVRPLIGMNKLEVEEIARKIGTYQIAAERSTVCPYVPERPRTAARVEEVAAAEASLGVEEVVERCLRAARKSVIQNTA